MDDNNVTLLSHILCCRIQRCSKNHFGAFGDWSHSNILMRFVVIVVGKCCFIQTKTSCTATVPSITYPWESFQRFWGKFISREGSKQEPWSSQSENRCFNGNNNNKKKNKATSGKCSKSLVLVPHWNENTSPDTRSLCGSTILISGCLSQKLHGLSEKRSFAGPVTPWPLTPCLDFSGDITHLLLLSVLLPRLPSSLWQCRRTAQCFALFFFTCWNAQSGSQKPRKLLWT